MRTPKLLITLTVLCLGLSARAAVTPSSGQLALSPESTALETKIKRALALRYPQARIDLTSPIQWLRGAAPQAQGVEGARISIVSENARGEAHFEVQNAEYAEGVVRFAAWVSARVALRRIFPGEKLSPEFFAVQELNLLSQPAFEYRSVIYPSTQEVMGFEARQTILDGQFLTSAQIQKVPRIKRGDAVQLQIHSGNLVLSVPATATEPGYANRKLRIYTNKTKREFSGELTEEGTVEVEL